MVTSQVPDVGVMTMMRKARSRKDETLIELLMDLTREHGRIFQLPGSGPRNLMVSSFALVDELCDEQRFDKTLCTGQLEVRGLVGDGLFTASLHLSMASRGAPTDSQNGVERTGRRLG